MEEFVEYFKALSDITRLKIMWILSKANAELCVCEVMDSLEESHYNISRHLKILKTAKLVKEKKEGKWVYFSLADPKHPFHEFVLQTVLNIPEQYFFNDTRRLKLRLSLRENERCVDGLKSEKWIQLLKLYNSMNGKVKKVSVQERGT